MCFTCLCVNLKFILIIKRGILRKKKTKIVLFFGARPSIIYHLSSIIYLLSSIFYHLSSIIYLLGFWSLNFGLFRFFSLKNKVFALILLRSLDFVILRKGVNNMDKEKIQDFVAEMLKELRLRHGMSKSAMADLLYINPKTWSKFEAGTSSPTLAEFLTVFDELGEDPLRSSLIHFYPETYAMIQSDCENEELCRAISNYFKNVASDKDVADWSYLVFGAHGSNISPQLQEFITIDHLPLKYRYVIAKEVQAFWELAQSEGNITDEGNNMPNIELFEKGIKKAKQAIDKGLNGYGMALDGDDAGG